MLDVSLQCTLGALKESHEEPSGGHGKGLGPSVHHFWDHCVGRKGEMGGLEHMSRSERLQELGLSRLALGDIPDFGF